MKKLTSLLLAVLMLLSLAVTASAGNIIHDSDIKPVTKDELLGIFTHPNCGYYCELNHVHDYTCNYGYGYYYGNTYIPGVTEDTSKIYTSWYGSCPECKGLSFFYVYGGSIKWKCFESLCGKNGTFTPDTGSNNTTTPVGTVCPTCKDSKNLTLIDTYYDYSTMKYINWYLCSGCVVIFSSTSTTLLPDCGINTTYVTCYHTDCSEKAYFDEYFWASGYLFANYKCANGHVTAKRVYGSSLDKCLYNVRVYTSNGGSYYVAGGANAAWGEKKTITFTASYGYVLTDVYVNGERVANVTPEMTIEVKGNTVVRAYFTKISTLKSYTAKATAIGGGEITATLNSKKADPASITAKYTDKITYTFVPSSANYAVEYVKVNGKNIGAVKSYTLDRIKADTVIEVKFKWVNPYDDIDSNNPYLAAIEYATEAGILTGSKTTGFNPAYNYNGTRNITVKTFACALAEMSDVNEILKNNVDRSAWAVDFGLIGEDEKLDVVCDVKRACDMVKAYLIALEDINDIRFVAFDDDDSAKDNAIAIEMVTDEAYESNKNINKYDLTAILYLISNLKYVG